MADEIKPGDESGKEPTVQELQTQIQNLNRGIAGYRDTATQAAKEAKEAKAEAAAAKAEAAGVKSAIEEAKDETPAEEVKLNPSDQKKLEAWAKAQGFVTKAEVEQQTATLQAETIRSMESQAVDEFTKSHPEYEDATKWELVKKEFGQYKQPTSLTGYRDILKKIHKELSQESDKAAEIRAQQELKNRLGLGGGNQKDGGEDVTLEKLQERYPSLSKEQIESRLLEINNLATERAKRNAARKK